MVLTKHPSATDQMCTRSCDRVAKYCPVAIPEGSTVGSMPEAGTIRDADVVVVVLTGAPPFGPPAPELEPALEEVAGVVLEDTDAAVAVEVFIAAIAATAGRAELGVAPTGAVNGLKSGLGKLQAMVFTG